MLQSMGSQRVKHDLTTEQQQRGTGVYVWGGCVCGCVCPGKEMNK